VKVGVIGSGEVGLALATGFAARGDEVVLGSRDPAKPAVQDWARRTGAKARAGAFADAASFGEVVVLATLWSGTENALRLAGQSNLAGKVLIDVTNPLAFEGSGPPRLAIGHNTSGGEQVQRWAPGARVVKAFNIINSASMVRPDFPGGPPDLFICGDDAGARRVVAGIGGDFGFSVIDIGGIEGSQLLEPLAMLWITVGINSGAWSHAFKLLRK